MAMNASKKLQIFKEELFMTNTEYRILKAERGGYKDILDRYPDAEIQKIKENGTEFYAQIGYEIIRDGNRILAVKA